MTVLAPDASVIICAFTEQRWDDLVSAVASVRQQTIPPREIIVVVDHNPALLARVTEQIAGVRVVENIEARGAAGARNSGAGVALGNLLVFLDDDAIACPHWLERLAACFSDPHVMGVGGTIKPRWEKGRPRWFPKEFDWVVGCTYRGMPVVRGKIRNTIASNMAVRHEVYEQVGGFRRGTGPGGTEDIRCDETEFCIRVRQTRPEDEFLFEPKALVYNRIPADRSTFSYFCSRCHAEGISKATLAVLWGARDSLSSERTYTLHTLPRGVFMNLAHAVRWRDHFALARAVAIVLGFALVTAGYLRGIVRNTRRSLSRRWHGARAAMTDNPFPLSKRGVQ